MTESDSTLIVTPAKAGVQGPAPRRAERPVWIPAFAGMTGKGARVTGKGAGMTNKETAIPRHRKMIQAA